VSGLAACVAPGPRYSSACEDRAYASSERRHADDCRDDDYRPGGHRNVSSCANCGVVQCIEAYSDDRRSSGGGAVAGAIIGGVIGDQVGSGSGRTAATVAGAIGGGIVGHSIEGSMQHGSCDITIRRNSRRTVVVSQNRIDGMREGSRVIVRNGRARLL
jgi:outer membrane lipoprotein SlyB